MSSAIWLYLNANLLIGKTGLLCTPTQLESGLNLTVEDELETVMDIWLCSHTGSGWIIGLLHVAPMQL